MQPRWVINGGGPCWIAMIELFHEQLRIFRGREVNTTGDGFVASFDGPARAIRCGQAIIDATRALGIELHVGIHTGECEVRGKDLGGLAVHIAARVGSLASPSEVLVSGTVKDLVVGSGMETSGSRRTRAEGCARNLEPLRLGGLTDQAISAETEGGRGVPPFAHTGYEKQDHP